jgi:hypothetical protein
MKVAENALVSNVLTDYHAVFWLAHSMDLARHFASIPRRISAIDAQTGRALGDTLKYRIFGRWVSETREQMSQLVTRTAPLLEGEEQRGMQFFRLLQDDVLILTEEFIGPDLRRRNFTGYLRRLPELPRSFQTPAYGSEQAPPEGTDLPAALPLFGVIGGDSGIRWRAARPRFETFLFEHPAASNAVTREEREQFQLMPASVSSPSSINCAAASTGPRCRTDDRPPTAARPRPTRARRCRWISAAPACSTR